MIYLYKVFLKGIKWMSPLLRLIPHEKLRYYFAKQGEIRFLKGSTFESRPVWIHASSGELEYARPLIREIQSLYPHIPLLVTHTSSSSLKALEGLPVTAIGVSPLDEKSEVEKFLSQTNPRACLIARTDLWPQMIESLSQKNIPVYLFSATFSSGMQKASWASRQILGPALAQVKKIYFVSTADSRFCQDLYPSTTGEIFGDTRYDQVFFRLQSAQSLSLPRYEKTLIAGSTWEEDESVLIPAAAELKKQNFKWIWVPHEVHPELLQKLQKALRAQNLNSILFSQISSGFSWNDTDILIVDKVGILASLYSYAQVAFIGGSFRRQVHSVMEALAAGCPVVVGPHHHNNREALEFKSLGYVRETQNSQELTKAFTDFYQNGPRLSEDLQKQMQTRKGATKKLIQDLADQGLFAKT